MTGLLGVFVTFIAYATLVYFLAWVTGDSVERMALFLLILFRVFDGWDQVEPKRK